MTGLRIVPVFIFACMLQISWAQDTKRVNQPKKPSAFTKMWEDFTETSSNAFSMKQHENWQIIAYVGLTAHFLFGNDYETQEEVLFDRKYKHVGLSNVMAKVGDLYDRPGPMYATAGMFGLMYGFGKVFNNDKMVETTRLMGHSLIITGIYTTALKVLIGRARPYMKSGPHAYRPFNFKFDAHYMSMPSGHTSSAFALVTVLAKQYNSWYVKVPAYTFASCVAMQRMNADKHWVSDLIIGGTLGYLIGSAVVARHNKKKTGFSLEPYFNGQQAGFAIHF